MEKFFNFNNEQALTPIDVDSATGEVSFELDGDVTTFASVQEFAEFYADARNVKADNLKNWSLVEDGDIYSFVLRAGSAGVDESVLASTARTLRASGMSAEEVARAMFNMQAEIREKEKQAQARREREDVVGRTLERVAGTNDEKLLFLAYDVTSNDELRDAIERDASLFEDNREVLEDDEEEYDDEYDDEWEEEDLEEELDDHDLFMLNLNEKIRAQKEEVESAFPGVPLDIALSVIFLEEVKEEYREGAVEAFEKAKRVASVAGRSVPVTIVDCADTDAPVVTSTFHNKDGVDVTDGTLCVYKRRFISLKNFNPVVVDESEFKDFTVDDDESDSDALDA